MHDWHVPVQAASQQTPSAQKPVVHSPAPTQAVPVARVEKISASTG